MQGRTQKVKLGVFVIVSAGLATVMAILFTAFSPFSETSRYYLLVDDVVGLSVGTPVHIRGVLVGRIGALELYADDRESVRLALDIDEGVPVNADEQAFIEYRGVTGLKGINIRGGDGSEGLLEPGGYIPRGKTLFDTLPERTEMLLGSASKLLESSNELIERVNETSQEIDSERVDRILEQTETMVTSMADTSRELNRLVREVRGPLKGVMRSSRELVGDVGSLAETLEKAVSNFDDGVSQARGVVNRSDDDLQSAVRNLRDASENFKVLSRDLRRQPRLLLFADPPEERDLP